jgi:hypothetical protein
MPAPTTGFSIFDGQELVTYEPASDPDVPNVPAVRRPLTQSRMRNIETFVTLQATDIVFHLDAVLLASTTLAAGDAITDAQSVTYQVLFIERQSLGNSAAAVCRPPAP